jgi:hypothetical protein
VPILFDFDKPASQDLTATVSTLAHLVRFIIADLTDPSSIPYELATVVPTTPVPVQPILLSGSSEFAMFQDLQRRYHWVLTTHRYDSQMQLIADLGEKVGPSKFAWRMIDKAVTDEQVFSIFAIAGVILFAAVMIFAKSLQ